MKVKLNKILNFFLLMDIIYFGIYLKMIFFKGIGLCIYYFIKYLNFMRI